MNISVFGLGYVGCVSVGCFAALGHNVIGVDVSPIKVDLINAGQSPVIEADLGDLIAEGVRVGRIRAVTESSEAVSASDVSFVCVGAGCLMAGNLHDALVTSRPPANVTRRWVIARVAVTCTAMAVVAALQLAGASEPWQPW